MVDRFGEGRVFVVGGQSSSSFLRYSGLTFDTQMPRIPIVPRAVKA